MTTVITAKVTPKASKNMLVAFEVGLTGVPILRIAVTAAPEKGLANKAVEELLAKSLKLPKSKVTVQKGKSSRLKIIAIDAEAEFVHHKLKEIIGCNR